MLPDPEYKRSFDPKADPSYRRFTREGILKALATIFVRNNEVIATTQVPFSATVVASVSELGYIRNVAVAKNTNNDDDDETLALFRSPQANFIERDRGTTFGSRANFQAYLVVNCWEKMHRRVRQWSFLGVVYLLYKISDRAVAQAYLEDMS